MRVKYPERADGGEPATDCTAPRLWGFADENEAERGADRHGVVGSALSRTNSSSWS